MMRGAALRAWGVRLPSVEPKVLQSGRLFNQRSDLLAGVGDDVLAFLVGHAGVVDRPAGCLPEPQGEPDDAHAAEDVEH